MQKEAALNHEDDQVRQADAPSQQYFSPEGGVLSQIDDKQSINAT